MRSAQTAGIFLLIAHSTACAGMKESELVGRWRAEYAGGYEILTLDKSHEYRQEIMVRDTQGSYRSFQNVGKWEYDTARWPTVVLHDCVVALNDREELRPDPSAPKGDCVYPVEREWGLSRKLRIGSVEGTPYYRTSDKY